MNPEQAKQLRKEFDRSLIGKLPKGGTLLDFVGHAATTDRLLQVDPEWTWEPFATDAQGLPALDAAGNLWIKLTVCGVTRPGVGDGKNMKERIGDAIRNAAMRFGVALDLWAKEDLHAAEEQPAPTPQPLRAVSAPPAAPVAPASNGDAISPAQLKMMGALMSKLGMTNRDEALAWVHSIIGREIASRNDLTKREATKVIDALKKAEDDSANPATGEVVSEDPWVVNG